MAYDWLGDLFRQWGRKPGRRAAGRSRIAVERLEARDVPNAAYPILAPEPLVLRPGGFVPGPNITPSLTEVVVAVRGADPAGTLRGLVAAAGPAAPAVDLAEVNELVPGNGYMALQVKLAAGADPLAVVNWFSVRPEVAYAVPSYMSLVDPRRFVPNDALYPLQQFHANIQSEKAWDTTTGSPSIIVSINDDGLDLQHPDLKANLWVNKGEIAGDGIDNDSNGYVDDVNGWDFTSFKNGVQTGDSDVTPTDVHGTHVGGLVAARADNGIGVAGVAGGRRGADGKDDLSTGVQLMTTRVIGGGYLSYSTVAISKSLRYSADNGAKIVNSSLDYDLFVDGAGTIDPLIRDAVDYMYGKGVLHIYASGNENSSQNPGKAYTHSITVAATNDLDRKASYSNYGRYIDVSGPGGDFTGGVGQILSTVFPQGYGQLVGTSMASPVVAGVAALIWSAHPTWTRDQVAAQLLGTADRIDALNPTYNTLLGAGRVNAFRGVTETLAAPQLGKTIGLPAEGSTVQALSQFEIVTPYRFAAASVTPAAFELRGAGADDAFGTPDDVLVPVTINSNLPYRIGTDSFVLAFPALAAGRYRFTVSGGAGGLTDPFGTSLDGDANGTAGGDFVRQFVTAPPLSGLVFESRSGTPAPGPADVGVPGLTVYLDTNTNGKFDAGETTAVTGFGGRYVFANVPAGAYTVAVADTPGWVMAPGSAASLAADLTAGGTVGGLNFALRRPGAVYGGVFVDPDGDGKLPAGGAGLAGFQVLLDADGDGAFDAPTKTTKASYANPATVSFPAGQSADSLIVVPAATGLVTSVQVRLSGTHDNFAGFLNFTVQGPDGTRVRLAQNSEALTKYTNTVFDSSPGFPSITTAFGTATGTYQPVASLDAFRGRSPVGTWSLTGTATRGAAGGGQIRGWQLLLTTSDGEQVVVTDAGGSYRLDAAPGANTVVIGRQQGLRLTTPADAVSRTAYTYAVTTTGGAAGPYLLTGLQKDATPPRLQSITAAGSTVTNSPTVTFNVRFSEPLDGLTKGDFQLTSSGFASAPSITGVTQTAPGLYAVTVATPGKFGTVALVLPAGGQLVDPALNPLAGTPLTGDAVTVDTLPPTSTLTLPPAASGKRVFTSANFPGRLTGTAADGETGVADVLVTVRQESSGLYFDGTSFTSPTPVPVPATVNPVGGGYTLPLSAGLLSEGQYTVTEAARDLAGNVQTAPNTVQFGIDNGPPTVLVSPTAGVFVNTDPVSFVLTFSEPVSGDLAAAVGVTGGTLVGVTGSGASYTVSVRPTRSGPVTVTVPSGAVTDFAGNRSPLAAATVTFDGTAPTVSLPAGQDGQATTTANFSGAISGTAGDDLSGVAQVRVAVRKAGTNLFFNFNDPTKPAGFSLAAPDYKPAVGTTAWSFAFGRDQFAGDDTYQFLVQATDAAGNPSVSPVSVAVDNAAPAPAVGTPAGGALVNAAAFELNGRRLSGTAADATSGPAATEVAVRRSADGLYWNGSAFVPAAGPLYLPTGGTPAAWTLPSLTADRLLDGQYQVTVRTTDRAGNVGTAGSVFTYDNTPTRLVQLAPVNGVGYNTAGFPGQLGGRLADSGDTTKVEVTLQRASDRLYWNGSFFGSAAPVLLPTVLAGDSFAYGFSPFGFPAEGVYTFTAYATDKAGSVGVGASTFSYDNSAPTSAVTPASSAAVFSPNTFPGVLTGTAADTLSGVGLVTVSLRQVATGRYFDGAGFNAVSEAKLAAAVASPNAGTTGWSFAVPLAALPADGQYLANAYATDVAGNVQPFGTPYAFGFDATPPRAAVQADKGAVTNVSPLSFTVGFTAAVTGLDPAGLAVTNGTVLDVVQKSDVSFVVRVTPTADGPVGLTVTPSAARDAAGNPTVAAGPAVGQFDRTPPTLTLTAPVGVLPLGQPATLTATFSEPVTGFGAASLRVTNATVLGVSGGGTTYQVQVLPAGPGGVTVSVAPGQFADAAGNAGTASVELTRTSEDPRYAVAVANVVRQYDARNGLRSQVAPFGDGYTGSIRVASADFNADGIPDVVAGTGPGGVTDVRVLDGRTNALLFQFTPFEESFTGGVFVAAGDVTGDGVAELIVTPDEGGGPRVRVFDGTSFAQVADFFGIEDSAFRGGARATVGDINGDGTGDLIVAAGFGGGPRVAVFDGRSVSRGEGNLQRVVGDFFAYESTLSNGVYVAAGDLDGDGKAELVTAGGPGGGPRVTAFSGADLAAGRLTRTADFFAGDPNSRDGVRVAVKRMAAGGASELVVGGGGTNVLRVYTGDSLAQPSPAASFEQDLLPGVGGVFVG